MAFTLNDIIDLEYDEECIEMAIHSTVAKFLHTSTTQMYARTPLLKLENIFMGDFAKNAIMHTAKKQLTSLNNDLIILDYDQVRADKFLLHDAGWDIALTKHLLYGEVKSSYPPRSNGVQYSDQRILNELDFKITAWKDGDDSETRRSKVKQLADVFFQVYFMADELTTQGTCETICLEKDN